LGIVLLLIVGIGWVSWSKDYYVGYIWPTEKISHLVGMRSLEVYRGQIRYFTVRTRDVRQDNVYRPDLKDYLGWYAGTGSFSIFDDRMSGFLGFHIGSGAVPQYTGGRYWVTEDWFGISCPLWALGSFVIVMMLIFSRKTNHETGYKKAFPIDISNPR
jgi:hypothetical protein